MAPFSADNISQRQINMIYWNSNRGWVFPQLKHNKSDDDDANLSETCSSLPHEETDMDCDPLKLHRTRILNYTDTDAGEELLTQLPNRRIKVRS